VARDYQLVARFYRENPIVQIGFGAKVSPQKISSQVINVDLNGGMIVDKQKNVYKTKIERSRFRYPIQGPML
jgi:hypothetical protein